MSRRQAGVSASGAVAAVANAYAAAKALECTDTTTAEPDARLVPGACFLGWAHIKVTAIAGGALTLTWYLAADANGDDIITEEQTDTIVVGYTTATEGAVVGSFEHMPFVPWVRGSVWIHAKTDAGTVTAVGRVYWSTE